MNTLLDAFLHFTLAKAVMLNELNHELEKAAVKVEKTAKAKLGHYQEASGTFNAWAELADSTKAERVAQGYTPNDPLLRSGKLKESITHESNHLEAIIGTNIDYAVDMETGSIKSPPRPFLAPALFENKEHIVELVGGAVITSLAGAMSKTTRIKK